jgi:hypothetical protein
MGLKGYRLWVMGQLDSMCSAPPHILRAAGTRPGLPARGVALQAAFERQTLKPVFHLIGYRLWV